MRGHLDELVQEALQSGSAVPAFTCYDFTTATAVVSAAEDAGKGVILMVAPRTAATQSGLRLISALRSLADTASVPVVVQLDHAADVQVMVDAVDAGADSVLADGSALSYEENIALVLSARRRLGTSIVLEAELGGLAGDEDRAFGSDIGDTTEPGLTNPDQVAAFVARTGAGLLAVAVGNVHGRYKGEPRIHWDILKEVSTRTEVPLVLHGASGIPQQELAKAASLNVGKVNFNTELRTGILNTLETRLPQYRRDGENMQGVLGEWSTVAHAFATSAMSTLAGGSATR